MDKVKKLLRIGVSALRKRALWSQKPLLLHYEEVRDGFLHSSPPPLVLDAGCGGRPYAMPQGKCKAVIGVDREAPDGETAGIDARVIGDLGELPFRPDIFDMIVSLFVVEHLGAPAACFKEFNRVCKPGGVAIIVTPNLWHYANLIVALTPHWLHRWFDKAVLGGIFNPYPTTYRANSPKKLVSEMKKAGFELVEVRLLELDLGLAYLEWLTPAYAIGLMYHRLVNRFRVFSGLRHTILASFRKVAQLSG